MSRLILQMHRRKRWCANQPPWSGRSGGGVCQAPRELDASARPVALNTLSDDAARPSRIILPVVDPVRCFRQPAAARDEDRFPPGS